MEKKVLAFRTLKAEEIDNIEQFNYISYLIKMKKTKNISIKTKIPAPGTLAILKKYLNLNLDLCTDNFL